MIVIAVFSCREAAWLYFHALEALIEQMIERDKAYYPTAIQMYESETGYVIEISRITYQALGYKPEFKL